MSHASKVQEFELYYQQKNIQHPNIYAVQQDTRSFLMIEFIHHIC